MQKVMYIWRPMYSLTLERTLQVQQVWEKEWTEVYSSDGTGDESTNGRQG